MFVWARPIAESWSCCKWFDRLFNCLVWLNWIHSAWFGQHSDFPPSRTSISSSEGKRNHFFFPNFNCEMTSTILVQHVLIWIHELRAQSAAIYDQLVKLACVITQSQKVWNWMAKQQSMNIKCWILKHGLVRIGVAKIYMSFWRDIVWNAWWRCLRSIAAAILHGVLQLISREAVLWRISSVVSQVWCELINCHGGEYGGGRG